MDKPLSALTLPGIAQRLEANWPGFLSAFRWSVLIFMAALLCDAVATTHFMLNWGTCFEIHPAVRWLSQTTGPVAGPLLGAVYKAVVGLALAVYLRRFARPIFVTGAFLAFGAACYNLWGYLLTLWRL